MDRRRTLWAVAQATLPVGMVIVSYFALTSFLWWPLANVLAAGFGLAAAATVRNLRRAAILCAVATGLYTPSNFFFGIMNFLGGGVHWIPLSFFSIAVAQGILGFFAWQWTRPWDPDEQKSNASA